MIRQKKNWSFFCSLIIWQYTCMVVFTYVYFLLRGVETHFLKHLFTKFLYNFSRLMAIQSLRYLYYWRPFCLLSFVLFMLVCCLNNEHSIPTLIHDFHEHIYIITFRKLKILSFKTLIILKILF